MKELVHAFSCAYIELWMHLGSLESTQEARVALTLLLCFPNFLHASITQYMHTKHEPILSYWKTPLRKTFTIFDGDYCKRSCKRSVQQNDKIIERSHRELTGKLHRKFRFNKICSYLNIMVANFVSFNFR